MDYTRNNLDRASSPYLQQHKENPIHWQEWSPEVLELAKNQHKLIFVSIGYATCHWCHVMASEAFSNPEVADFLNQHFISIKVDREQRPDLDQYFMEFISETKGYAGWPLNVILTPDQKPFFAGTYFPESADHGLPGFRDLLRTIRDWHRDHKDEIEVFEIQDKHQVSIDIDETELIEVIKESYDKHFSGFGAGTKFPPHSTLIFLLHYYEITKDITLRAIILSTLDAMSNRGLHDHLQGGFYRYCVDREWNIPHFEKMLYDQALALQVYSLAYKVFRREQDRIIVDKLISCLEQTFSKDGLYISAHDADTDHKEGSTYVWAKSELKKQLTESEYDEFAKLYNVSSEGNFERRNHLIKREPRSLLKIEAKLLEIRRRRKQPFADEKIITSWNALLGIGLIFAHRYTEHKRAFELSTTLYEKLLTKHRLDDTLFHSSKDEQVDKHDFLQDYASMMLFASYLYEETRMSHYKKDLDWYDRQLNAFYFNGWKTNRSSESFLRLPAESLDSPIPSAVSLVQMAKFRYTIISGEERSVLNYVEPIQRDYFNLLVLLSKGNIHEIHGPELLKWSDLSLRSVQIPGKDFQDCYGFHCRQFQSPDDLIALHKQEVV